MKQIIFNRIQIEGFKSIGSIDFNFQENEGINLIKGSNGVGKTTLLEAIHWVLWGHTLKEGSDVLTWAEYRQKSYRGCRVILELIVDGEHWAILRTHKFTGKVMGRSYPSSLVVFDEDFEPYEGQHKGNHQEFIEDLLGVGENVFLNSILFGQRMERFISSSAEEKRKILDQLFNLDFIESAKEKAKDFCLTLGDRLLEENQVRQELKLELQKIEQARESYLDSLNQYKENQQTKIRELEGFLNTMAENLEVLHSQKRDLNGDKSFNYSDYESLLRLNPGKEMDMINMVMSKLDKEIEGIQNKLSGTCPACGGPLKISPDEKKKLQKELSLKEKELREKEESFKILQETSKKYNEDLMKMRDQLQKYEENQRYNKELDLKIARLEAEEDHKIQQLEDIKNQTPPKDITKNLDKAQMEYETKLEEQDRIMQGIVEERANYDWWVKTGFGAGGLKNYMFDALLTNLNQEVAKYAAYFGFEIRLGLDLDKARKTFKTEVLKSGVLVKYSELSGGEKARVDIALSFAIHNLLSTSSVSFNILFMDEFFEGLDEVGLYETFELIREKAKMTNVYLISHSSYLDTLGVNIINMEKENGITKIS